MRKTNHIRVLAIAMIAGLALTGSALAIDARLLVDDAVLADEVNVNNDHIRLKTKAPTEVTVQEAILQPGDVVPFHGHPGIVLTAVKQGTLTRIHDDCRIDEHVAGSAFVEAGDEPVRVENRGRLDTVIYVTYLHPKGSPRIVPTAADRVPNC